MREKGFKKEESAQYFVHESERREEERQVVDFNSSEGAPHSGSGSGLFVENYSGNAEVVHHQKQINEQKMVYQPFEQQSIEQQLLKQQQQAQELSSREELESEKMIDLDAVLNQN